MPTPGSEPDEYPIDASAKADIPLDTAVRLCRQERKVLDLLLASEEVSNVQLSTIALRYGTTLSTLRAAGWDIQLRRESGETGVAWYFLASHVPHLRTYRVPVEVRVPGFQAKQVTFTVQAISPRSARYRAWRAVKVIALSPPTEIFPASQGELFYRSPSSRSTAE